MSTENPGSQNHNLEDDSILTKVNNVNPFRETRDRKIQNLRDIASKENSALYMLEESGEAPEKVPDNLIRDDLTNFSLQFRSMEEANEIYDDSKDLLGRTLAHEEEEMMLTTLSYALKRVINAETQRSMVRYPVKGKRNIYHAMDYGAVLPGDRDMFVRHDFMHIILAIQQGVTNDNSTVPEFMKSEKSYNGGGQAMLEEAFATLFTPQNEGDSYDTTIKKATHFKDTPLGYLDIKEPASLFFPVGPENYHAFNNQADFDKTVPLINSFFEKIHDKLNTNDPLTNLALTSQLLSLEEKFSSWDFRGLSPEEKIVFIKEGLQFAEENIDALITGEVSEDKDEKYKKTVKITRDAVDSALNSIAEDPEKPIFLDVALSTLKPLYTKAKAQEDATFTRAASAKYDIKA